MSILTHDEILELQAAVISAGLSSSRPALLMGIHTDLVGSLPVGQSPTEQVLSDLGTLSSVGTLRDGSVPLGIWLRNAISLAGPRVEGLIFERALEQVHGFIRIEKRTVSDLQSKNKCDGTTVAHVAGINDELPVDPVASVCPSSATEMARIKAHLIYRCVVAAIVGGVCVAIFGPAMIFVLLFVGLLVLGISSRDIIEIIRAKAAGASAGAAGSPSMIGVGSHGVVTAVVAANLSGLSSGVTHYIIGSAIEPRRPAMMELYESMPREDAAVGNRIFQSVGVRPRPSASAISDRVVNPSSTGSSKRISACVREGQLCSSTGGNGSTKSNCCGGLTCSVPSPSGQPRCARPRQSVSD